MKHQRILLRAMLWTGLSATWSLGWAPAALADTSPFPNTASVYDADLDRMRGGFLLPNGMDIAIGIEIDTLVNGALALRTVLTVDQSSTLSIFSGGELAASGQDGGNGASSAVPGLPSIRVTQDPSAPPAPGPGQEQLVITPNGPPVTTQWGAVQLQQDSNGAVVVLTGSALELRHMIGTLTGTLVANTANDRVIDTMVTVNVDLRNSAVPIGNSMIRLEPIMLGAAGRGLF